MDPTEHRQHLATLRRRLEIPAIVQMLSPERAGRIEAQWVQADPELFQALIRLGIIVHDGGDFRRAKHIIKSGSAYIMTDVIEHRPIKDRVFPFGDEGMLLLRQSENAISTLSQEPKYICDLGSGAGTVGITLAARFKNARVVCIDKNERATQYVKENSLLNEVEGNVESRKDNWLETALKNHEKFDIVLANPPMAMHPEEVIEADHSAGGADGERHIRTIMEQVPAVLRPGGRLIMCFYTLGTSDTDPDRLPVVDFITKTWPAQTWRLRPLIGERMWRVGAVKMFKSPMDIHCTLTRLFDSTYQQCIQGFTDEGQQKAIDAYLKYLKATCTHHVLGLLTHLHYVCLEYQAPLE